MTRRRFAVVVEQASAVVAGVDRKTWFRRNVYCCFSEMGVVVVVTEYNVIGWCGVQ